MFDEAVFVRALTNRYEDARIFTDLFRPEWIKDPALRAILAEVYQFTKQHGLPPTVAVLEQIFQEEDQAIYETRYRAAFERLKAVQLDRPTEVYVLHQAKNEAICRSMQAMVEDLGFQRWLAGAEGHEVLKAINKWQNQFLSDRAYSSATLQEAWQRLLQEDSWGEHISMGTGIDPIDEWTDGGLSSQNLGIIMAPTGHGKSIVLMNIVYAMAIQNEIDVWFVTNELTLGEQSQRLLSRMTGVPLNEIRRDPFTVDSKFKKAWDAKMDQRLRMTSVNEDISTAQLEAEMLQWAHISGWKPKVLVLDFMERMRPSESGYERSQEWQWLGAIAKDLVRFAKKHNLIIWTACQTNRSGLNESLPLSMTMAQSSTRHFQEAAMVLSMRKSSDADGVEFFEFKPHKNRWGPMDSKSVFLKVNLKTMLITDETYEPPAQTGITDDDDDDGSVNPARTKAQTKKKGRK